MRYRLAGWLLGYEPHRKCGLHDAEGVTLVIRQGDYQAGIATSSLKLEMTNDLRPFGSDLAAYFKAPRGPHGTFSGTIGKEPEG